MRMSSASRAENERSRRNMRTPHGTSGESFHKRLYWSALQGWRELFVCCAAFRERGRQFAAVGRMMAKRKRESSLAGATRSFQENVSRSGAVAGASYTL